MLGRNGRLLGIGSLFVGDAAEGEQSPGNMPGNMFVPIDALKPILSDLLTKGRRSGPAQPWLGVFTELLRDHLFVSRVSPGGPAATAGLSQGDIIVAVNGEPVRDMVDFYRKVWALGDPGVTVPLTVLKGGELAEVEITSADRYDYLKLRPDL